MTTVKLGGVARLRLKVLMEQSTGSRLDVRVRADIVDRLTIDPAALEKYVEKGMLRVAELDEHEAADIPFSPEESRQILSVLDQATTLAVSDAAWVERLVSNLS